MNKIKKYLNLGLLMLLFSSGLASAGVYWLPDYIGNNNARTSEDKPDNFNDDCSHYQGMSTTCQAPKISEGKVTVAGKLKCYKNCRCDSSYNKTCSDNYQGGETACGGKNKTCVCKAEFNKTSADCSAAPGFKLGSNLCDGKSDRCESLTCSEGGYFEKPQADRQCEARSYGTHTCYQCTQPSCSDGSYQDKVLSTQKCSAVTYYGRTCYTSCYQPQCSEGGYLDSIPTNQKCTAVPYYGRTCQTNCYQPTCSAGGYEDNVPADKKCTAVTYYGRNCQKDCRDLTCEDKGLKTCNGSCIASDQCCSDSDCRSPQKCDTVTQTCYTPDPCADINCGDNGSCSNGRCICNPGYSTSGNNCVLNCKAQPNETVTILNSCRSVYGFSPTSMTLQPGSYTSITLEPVINNQGTNQTINIYGDFTTASLYLIPAESSRTDFCGSNGGTCNINFVFHGKVTINKSLIYVSSFSRSYYIGGTYTNNITATFKQGISGAYKCYSWWLGEMSNSETSVSYYCPNGGAINSYKDLQ